MHYFKYDLDICTEQQPLNSIDCKTHRSEARRWYWHDVNEEDIGWYGDLFLVEVQRPHDVTQQVAIFVPQLSQVILGHEWCQVGLVRKRS